MMYNGQLFSIYFHTKPVYNSIYMNGYRIFIDDKNQINSYGDLEEWLVTNYVNHIFDWLTENNYPLFNELTQDVQDFILDTDIYIVTEDGYITDSEGQYVDLDDITEIMRFLREY